MRRKTEKVSTYFAIYDPSPEGGYDVSFPDFPGCVTFGRTFEEAKEKASEILELWIEELRERHKELPMHFGRPLVDEVVVSFA